MKIYESLKGKDVVHRYLQIKGNWAYFDIFPLYNCEAKLIWKLNSSFCIKGLKSRWWYSFSPRAWEKVCIECRISKEWLVLKIRHGPAVLLKKYHVYKIWPQCLLMTYLIVRLVLHIYFLDHSLLTYILYISLIHDRQKSF